MEMEDQMIEKLAGIEIFKKCIWANELERLFNQITINDTAKGLVENLIKEYREIATISMAKALISTKEQNAILENYTELVKAYEELGGRKLGRNFIKRIK